jgi:ATP-dependent RNA helicase DOB1
LQKQHDDINIANEAQIVQFKSLQELLANFKQDAHDVICHPSYIRPFLRAGRFVEIRDPADPDQNFGWSILAGCHETDQPRDRNGAKLTNSDDISYIIDVFVLCSPQTPDETGRGYYRAAVPGAPSIMKTLPFPLQCIKSISTVCGNINYDTSSTAGREKVNLLLSSIAKRMPPTGYPLLDPINDLKITDASFLELNKVRKPTKRARIY